MSRRLLAISLAMALCLLTACGSSHAPATSPSVPGGADPVSVSVIKAWADTLRRGEVAKAAGYFAIPSVIENAAPPLRISNRRGALAFNASLPCGARLVRAVRSGSLTIATFRLTERPGPGTCGTGTGQRAKVAFRLRDGKIAQWRRVIPGRPAHRGPTI